MATRTITRLYGTYDEATEAVRAIEAAGVPPAAISVVGSGRDSLAGDAGEASADVVGSGAGIGAVLDTLVGGGAGLLAGIGAIPIPGVGPVVAAGWLVAALTGAGVGAAAGGLLGSLAGAGVDEADAHVYAEGVRRGGTVLSARGRRPRPHASKPCWPTAAATWTSPRAARSTRPRAGTGSTRRPPPTRLRTSRRSASAAASACPDGRHRRGPRRMHRTMREATGRDDAAVVVRRAAAPPAAAAESREFHDMLVAAMPRLRVHALSLTRNRAEADDLVQDAVALALRGRDKFEPGTNFSAWTHRIVRNRFLSLVRQRRAHADLDEAIEGATADHAGPPHDDRLVLKELARMLGRLPTALREALILVAVQGRSYEEVATVQGCAVGTAKSRVFRARYMLRLWLLGGPASLAAVKTAQARASALSRTEASS